MEHLKYGLRNGELIHIDDVERGLACNCVCPHCKTQLISRKGEKNIKHFAHYKLADCNHGAETALHLMAKEIIQQTRTIFVPYIPKTVYDFSHNGTLITFEKAVLEKQLSDNIRGDVVLYNENHFLNVEIKVTHEVEAKKNIELFNLGIPTVEIDFSDMKLDFTPESIEERLLNGVYTNLIHSPKNKEIFAKRILGEWKKVYGWSSSRYVNDCPRSRKRAYFMDILNKGGSCECHECNAGYQWNGCETLLCFGCLDSIDFNQVDKILHLEKEENHISSVKLLMNDGSVIEKEIK